MLNWCINNLLVHHCKVATPMHVDFFTTSSHYFYLWVLQDCSKLKIKQFSISFCHKNAGEYWAIWLTQRCSNIWIKSIVTASSGSFSKAFFIVLYCLKGTGHQIIISLLSHQNTRAHKMCNKGSWRLVVYMLDVRILRVDIKANVRQPQRPECITSSKIDQISQSIH